MRISDWSSDVCSSDLHPETGRNALNLGRRLNAYIPGLEVEESEKLLDQLWAHAAQDFLSWRQKWQVGDVIIWDNRCTMHRREDFDPRSEEHTSELQSLMRISYAVFCLKKTTKNIDRSNQQLMYGTQN